MTLPNHMVINRVRYVMLDVEAFAHVFANWGADDQARFLNEVGRVAAKWEHGYGHGEKQWCSMADELNKDGRAVLLSMAQFATLKKQSRKGRNDADY